MTGKEIRELRYRTVPAITACEVSRALKIPRAVLVAIENGYVLPTEELEEKIVHFITSKQDELIKAGYAGKRRSWERIPHTKPAYNPATGETVNVFLYKLRKDSVA